jgi:hypothetical protein
LSCASPFTFFSGTKTPCHRQGNDRAPLFSGGDSRNQNDLLEGSPETTLVPFSTMEKRLW